jgi:signal transduction histidine kinase
MKDENAQATVMVVDDTPANLRYLQEVLRIKGYRVVAFPEGSAALHAAAKKPPDLILLDILMPEMDGFEVCRRLKADPALSKIPILFVSALSDGDHKVRAFEAGGVDYVTKPFEEREVLSRVETHLRLYRLTRGLENMVEERMAQLSESKQTLEEEMTIRKQAEKELRTQEAMLQSVFEGIEEPLLLVDRDMQVKLFNKAASAYYQALGISLTCGKRLCDECGRAHQGASDACAVPESVLKSERQTLERKGIADPDRIEQVVFYPVDKKGCETGEIIMRIADITEERMLAQEMAQADKLIALGTITAGVAHEINNPNHISMLNAPILADLWAAVSPIIDRHCDCNGDFKVGAIYYSEIKEEIPQLISGIESSAKRIKRIVDVLKDYAAKRDRLSLSSMDINEAVKNALFLMNHRIKEKTERFDVSYQEHLPAVMADCGKLEQVFVNLLSNALDAIPDRSKGVLVNTRFDEKAQLVLFEVSDEGAGISQKNIRRIMEPFFTTRRSAGGTGLGLSIAKHNVDLHGGRLEVESTEGCGSTFRVALPALLPEKQGVPNE